VFNEANFEPFIHTARSSIRALILAALGAIDARQMSTGEKLIFD
jgi:hypothetical protein